MGSDGLFKYIDAESIRRTVLEAGPESACQTLIDLVRLRNGTLQDDVGVVVFNLS